MISILEKTVRYKVCMNDSLCQYVAFPTSS